MNLSLSHERLLRQQTGRWRHTVRPTAGVWECGVCAFIGSLPEALWHVVENQYQVPPSP